MLSPLPPTVRNTGTPAAISGPTKKAGIPKRSTTAPEVSPPATTIRLAPEDISRARALAARRGLRYQTYLKMLIHEALEREERKAS